MNKRIAKPFANVSGGATVWNCPNYVGELYLVGANQTPFLNMVGGLNRGQLVGSWEFPLNQQYALEAAAQPAITETASLTAPTATTYVRAQEKNVCQIFHRAVSISYAKQSNRATIGGLALTGLAQPVQSELDFQIQANLQQIALDTEYTFINGAYNLAGNAGQANKTRGMLAATTTNAINAGGDALTKADIDNLMISMANSGAKFGNMVLYTSATYVNQISTLYGYAPMDRNVGGVAVKSIITDFCVLSVVWDPFIPANTILIADVSAISPVFLPVPGKGILFYEELTKTGAAETGQLYGQIGLDYALEEFHGKITNIA